jgi:hypothetical protein
MDKCQFLINELVEKTLETSSVLQKQKKRALAELAVFQSSVDQNTKVLEQEHLKALAHLSAKPDSSEFEEQLYNLRMAKLYCSINQILKIQL